ncbi:hypothetical protein FOPE_06057 [Fonsecaea pedrosoi]|nr:hypothetical protein FOPE_06057 [Fonsecaea pedrosoi]
MSGLALTTCVIIGAPPPRLQGDIQRRNPTDPEKDVAVRYESASISRLFGGSKKMGVSYCNWVFFLKDLNLFVEIGKTSPPV